MVLIMKDGKELRVPGSAIPEVQCRMGAFGKLDGMSFSRFQRLPLIERKLMILDARGEQIDSLMKSLKKELDNGRSEEEVWKKAANTVPAFVSMLDDYVAKSIREMAKIALEKIGGKRARHAISKYENRSVGGYWMTGREAAELLEQELGMSKWPRR